MPAPTEGTAMTADAGIQRRVPARPQELCELRQAVAAYAEESCANAPEICDALVLAVTEAAANAMVHGYRGGCGGDVTLKAWTTADRLFVEIHDDGVGMGERSPSPGPGYGLRLMRAVAECEISSRAGTTIQLRFPRVPA